MLRRPLSLRDSALRNPWKFMIPARFCSGTLLEVLLEVRSGGLAARMRGTSESPHAKGEPIMSAEPMQTSDVIGLTKVAPFSRRGFMTATAAVTAGYTLAAGPV